MLGTSCLGLVNTRGCCLKCVMLSTLPQQPPNWPLQSPASEEEEAGHWWILGSWWTRLGHADLLQPWLA